MTLHGTIESPLELTFSLNYLVEPGQSPTLPNFSDEVGEPGYDTEAEILQLNFISIQVRNNFKPNFNNHGFPINITKQKNQALNLKPETLALILQALLEVPDIRQAFINEAIENEADQ